MHLGVLSRAEITIVEAQLGGNLSINLRKLGGAYLGLLLAFVFASLALLALFLILFLFLILLSFFGAL